MIFRTLVLSTQSNTVTKRQKSKSHPRIKSFHTHDVANGSHIFPSKRRDAIPVADNLSPHSDTYSVWQAAPSRSFDMSVIWNICHPCPRTLLSIRQSVNRNRRGVFPAPSLILISPGHSNKLAGSPPSLQGLSRFWSPYIGKPYRSSHFFRRASRCLEYHTHAQCMLDRNQQNSKKAWM